MSTGSTDLLYIVGFVCVALLWFGPLFPSLFTAIAALILAIIGFILGGWQWELALLLLVSAILFSLWWKTRKPLP